MLMSPGPCLTRFGNLTMYNWKMSQWSRPPLLVKFLNQEENTGGKNPSADWNNHPQTKAETTHTLKGWIPTGIENKYLGEISEFFRQLRSVLGKEYLLTWIPRKRGGDPRDTPGWPCHHRSPDDTTGKGKK